MATLARLVERNLRNSRAGPRRLYSELGNEPAGKKHEIGDEEFRVLNLRTTKQTAPQKRRVFKKDPVTPPRHLKMETDQDWTAVWPGPRTFQPASVPLPLRQGYTEKGAAPPSKFANAELMKIPNFLHLTPPAIRAQCEALKQFCTPWPKGLESEEKCRKYFPIEIKSTDYCHALPTIRNSEARRITLNIKLSDLKFDVHAKDKFLRLVGDRYNSDTDIFTIVADRCPLRKQNYDYAMYLLTACYHESFVTEPWEASKSEADMEYYSFDRNKSKQSAEAIINWGKPLDDKNELKVNKGFAQSVENLINEGENEYNLARYKEEVLKLLELGTR
ncbi:PREDICTED: 28S ribosomal protein S35, mitochondrial [Rhagoletis zephyria]|uniref:28S ribosomal protein S35, mitochondrial n=1 Tax=Rhagoletis zephyria TaxID=28612 RepID=UPI0008112DC3|nr:PREDICTED: 28S ribosomal protein S35, mitochondrial [Rhagoletis zephyria]XP_017465855.1 PREDICTED: 28S ribosomal protein S35, mitochondrial [Rhagoletis zephyria]